MTNEELLSAIETDDAYELVHVLAEGARCITELVRLDGELYVRKRIPAELANREAWEALGKLHEPLLPQLAQLYELPSELVAVYAYVPGVSLHDELEQRGRLMPARAAGIVCDLCRAAGALHTAGIVHRDITPGNVVLGSCGAHLIDLGIARVRNDAATHDTTNLGTWGFAAPEQFGFAQTDARTDVYSLGRILAYLLTGMRPDAEGFAAALSDPALVPEELRAIIERATAFEPSARYQSAAELAASLRKLYPEAPRREPTLAGKPQRTPSQPKLPSHAQAPASSPDPANDRAGGHFTWQNVGPLRWIALAFIWVIGFGCAALFALGAIDNLRTGYTAGDVASWVLGFIIAAATALLTADITRAVLHLGPCAEAQGRIKRLAKRALAHVGVVLACAIVLTVILAIGGANFGWETRSHSEIPEGEQQVTTSSNLRQPTSVTIGK